MPNEIPGSIFLNSMHSKFNAIHSVSSSGNVRIPSPHTQHPPPPKRNHGGCREFPHSSQIILGGVEKISCARSERVFTLHRRIENLCWLPENARICQDKTRQFPNLQSNNPYISIICGLNVDNHSIHAANGNGKCTSNQVANIYT